MTIVFLRMDETEVPMSQRLLRSLALFVVAVLCLLPLSLGHAQGLKGDVHLIFMEPDSLTGSDGVPVFHLITDTNRVALYRSWMSNEPAQWAIWLFGEACRSLDSQSVGNSIPAYHIALVPGGNNGAVGFRLRDDTGTHSLLQLPYIALAPEEWAFTTTFLHETGHVVLSTLNGGKEIPKREIASIPHSTFALTDRGTAFDEGFAIHLETLAARFCDDPFVRNGYHHDRYLFDVAAIQSEYHRPVADLLTYSQTRTRYYNVAENSFAFCSAFKGPDYLRVQVEQSRDYSLVRNASQLLQSEGFYASFFYAFLLRGKSAQTRDSVYERQRKVLRALSELFRSRAVDFETPFLLYFAEWYMKLYPGEARDIVDVLLELSHWAFVDPQSTARWRRHYFGALRLDIAEAHNKLTDTLSQLRNRVVNQPKLLYSRLGPQIRCEVPGDSVQLLAFGNPLVLSFDVNTAQEGIIRLIPGISDRQVRSWLEERDIHPYWDIFDFKKRSGLNWWILGHLKF